MDFQRFFTLALVTLSVSCGSQSAPELQSQEMLPEIFEPATEAQREEMKLSALEAMLALIYIARTHYLEQSNFEDVPEIFMMKIGDMSSVKYSACLSSSLPSAEIGSGGRWPRFSRYKWANTNTCLQIAGGSFWGAGSDEWRRELGPTTETVIYNSEVKFTTLNTQTAIRILFLADRPDSDSDSSPFH